MMQCEDWIEYGFCGIGKCLFVVDGGGCGDGMVVFKKMGVIGFVL